MFPSLRSPRNIMGNNVSATMCPRLPGPLVTPSKVWHDDIITGVTGHEKVKTHEIALN